MSKKFKIVVLAKQVPDTRNVGKNAMKEDGTVNRAALPAIFNPEDMNALEQALRLKDRFPGSEVLLLTMGPGRAAEVIREGYYRGADGGVLLTDRKFAGADTLATSYALSMAIKKISPDIIIAGRQAIDGDTAQVGPQVAEKLKLPQVTYAEDIQGFENGKLTIKRRLERGVETVQCPIPAVITVHATAPDCRPRNAKQLMRFKHARTISEEQDNEHNSYLPLNTKESLRIPEWSVSDVGGDEINYGLSGSPTKVKKIENIVFQAKESKKLTSAYEDINSLICELISSHTIG
ncbi:MAG: electron transfer flavoprotein subunit beta/FixA family protein [Bacteroidales bacterium]|jgi:electron transfer flavoprotein beta subunit|nr:electron transfer flavoprotein subunit beta/FixA family protein [Bacteroidales bacterium]MDD3301025.1 electron transfer flavoprotein subunit beta/FixA family protein [Bacteroidales bacterium]MDD3844081.1 electron transfer flavoprotein subunit beta/FixA family protein [Bacteroidales bacterium]MDD4618212.1 electron transfer flavoprotein subunit beta/FixA family protein [Bacteroidales bacterium]